tara:strand:+ start:2111 stop:2848 length:738 start_codon:yes stop_codon:yes gene_type:complete
MADLTNSEVQQYVQIPAAQDVGDRFDQDNFYPMDGIIDDNDVAFSELFGGKLKALTKAGGSKKGLLKEVGSRLQTRAEDEGVGRLDKRLERRNRRALNRAKRKGMRITARGERQIARQAALSPPVVAQGKKLSVAAGPGIKEPLGKIEDGQGDPLDERVADKFNETAKRIVLKDENLDEQVVKEELQNVKTTTEADKILTEILDKEDPRGQSGWKGVKTPVKVGIIAGGVAVLGLATFLIVKASK